MTSAQLFRLSGLALVVGAVAFSIHLAARSVMTSGSDPVTFAREGLWVSVNGLGATGAALVLLGLPGLYARMALTAGLTGLVGVVLLALAWSFFGLFLSLYGMLLAPWLAEKAPALVAASAPLPAGFIVSFLVGLAAECVGTVLLAIPFLRRGVQPRWVGYVLPASAPLTLLGDLVAPAGPAANLALNLLSNLGPACLLVALAGLGTRMWSESAPAADAGLPRPRGA